VGVRISAPNPGRHKAGAENTLLYCLGPFLHQYQPDGYKQLSGTISVKIAEVFYTASRRDGDWTLTSTFDAAKRVIAAANMSLFFDPYLSADKNFRRAALDYPDEVFKTAGFLIPLPQFMRSIITALWPKNTGQASHIMITRLRSVIENRLKLGSALADAPGRSKTTRDYLQYIIDSTIDYGHLTTEDIVLTVLMTWLIAVHETAVIGTHALENLCKYPDYAELIRSEVIAIHTLGELGDSYGHDSDLNPSKLDQCPVLDAFLKETCRLAPPNAITMQRKARSAITFKDGTRILPGDLACVPSQAIMRDENFYQDSMSFFPRRFLDHGSQFSPLSRNLRFTGTENTYPLWGLGKHAWYVTS